MDKATVFALNEYMLKIGAAIQCSSRVSDFMRQYETLYGDEIGDIFIANYVKNDKIHFENLWFFSEKRWWEMRDFLTEDQITLVNLKNRVQSWTVQKNDYDFKDFEGDYCNNTAASASSTLSLSVILTNEQTLRFKAAGKNCDFLYKILKEHITKNERLD
jgi:hypothetical protein